MTHLDTQPAAYDDDGSPRSQNANPSAARGRRWIPWAIVGLLVMGLVAALAVTRLKSPDAPRTVQTTQISTVKTITVVGAISLGFGDFGWNSDDRSCWGKGGYDDMTPGASVTITDATGTVIAVGAVTTARAGDFSGPTATQCELSFVLPNVPAGKGFYGVEVTHRGSVKFDEAAFAAPIALTLG